MSDPEHIECGCHACTALKAKPEYYGSVKHSQDVAADLERVLRYYRDKAAGRSVNGLQVAPTVHSLMREFVNGW